MYTGERILPGELFNVTFQQSLLAYKFTEQFAVHRSVLDVACGEGYGLDALAAVAETVVGVDKDVATIAAARERYQQRNVSFRQADLFELPEKMHGQQFDVVCCFQTIEHVADHNKFLQALKAVTKPGGKIIVSTPNTNQFHSFNPYHVHEVTAAEITALFKRHFSDYTIYGVHGSKPVLEYRQSKQRIGDLILAIDFLHARRWLPERVIQRLYGFISLRVIKRLSHLWHKETVAHITQSDFTIETQNLEQALDFIAVGTLR